MEPAPVRLTPEPAPAHAPEAMLAAAFRALEDGVFIARYPERVVVEANDAFLRMVGYAREEIVGRSTEALHVGDAQYRAFAERIRAAIARGEPASVEWPLRRKDGTRFDAGITVTPLAPYGGGAPIGVVCVLRDLTAARRSAQERDRLALQEAFLAENSVDVVSRTGLDGVIRYVSPSCRTVLGYAPEEMVGHPATEFAPPDQLDAGLQRQRASAPQEPVTHLQRVQRKDGRWVWMESVVRVVTDASGAPQEYLAVARDVTLRKAQEEALERSEARWRGLAESAPGYIFNVARDGTILFINRVAEGVKKEDVVGQNQYARFAPADRERIRALHERVFETGKPVRYEVEAETRGARRWFENHVGPIVERDEVVALSVLTFDVTERKTAEQERERAQGLLEAVLSQMPSGVVVADAAGRVVHANARMDAIAGAQGRFDLPDVAAYAAWEGWRADGTPIAPHEWPLSRALATGQTVGGELVRVRSAKGGDHWCRVSAAPVRDAEERIIAGVAIVEDVSAELAAEASAETQRRRLASLIEAQTEMGDALLVTVGRRVEWGNDALLRLLGITREELLSPDFDALSFIPPADRAAATARGAERLSGRRLHDHYEMRIQRRDGTVVPVEVSARGETTPDGVRVTAMMRDVSQRKRQQEELEQARAQLARSEKLSALGSLVAGVAHELRTPLTYLSTNLDLVERGVERILTDLPQDRRDAARARLTPRLMEAREGMDRINRLVEDLRKFTKLRESGEWMDLDLAPIVDEAVGLYRATRRGDVKVVDDLSPTPIRRLDRVQIQQVVLNLLENAREARPRDALLRVRTYADAEGRPVLEVEDNGPGIAPEVQARMWDPFFTTKPDGSGLGLSIVKRIADAHGATLDCRSAPGHGTTFRLTFR